MNASTAKTFWPQMNTLFLSCWQLSRGHTGAVALLMRLLNFAEGHLHPDAPKPSAPPPQNAQQRRIFGDPGTGHPGACAPFSIQLSMIHSRTKGFALALRRGRVLLICACFQNCIG